MTLDVEALRKQIPTTQKMTYFNTGWEGPSPVPVVEAIKQRAEFEAYNGPSTPEVLDSGDAIAKQSKEAIAQLINATPEEILLTENTTDGLNVVIPGLDWKPGDEIITCNLEHPSVLMPSYNLTRIAGVKLNILQLSSNSTHDEILSKVKAAFTPRTKMAFFSHIEFSCGLRMPIKEIGKMARERGVLLLVDAAQGPGHIKLDMRDLDADFYSTPGHKWLLGPDGTGALYIRKDMIPKVRPVRVGYRFAKSFDQAGNFEPNTDDIDKFRVSTTSAAIRAGYLEAVRFAQNIGPGVSEERSLKLAAHTKAGLSSIRGVRVTSPLEGPGCTGLVTFSVDGVNPPDVVASLWKKHRVFARAIGYPPGIRVSLAYFNTEAEIAKLVEGVHSLVK